MSTILMTDSSCDLPYEYIRKRNIDVIGLVLNFRGKDIIDDMGQTINSKAFYDALRSGETATTAQINTYRFSEVFKKYAEEGHQVIYLAFSSGLSGTCNNAKLAREEVLEEYPDADITVIDTLCASGGVGLLVYYSAEMLNNGASKDDIIKFVENNKLRVNHYFTVNDLKSLWRGGRVSATKAVFGTVLDIKPVLNVDKYGHLIPISKVKGRKKSIRSLFENLKNRIENPEEQVILINHGDCEADAERLANMIRAEFNVKDIIIHPLGPVIGCHTGPDLLTVFFMGKSRADD